jgi:hypothetical protein
MGSLAAAPSQYLPQYVLIGVSFLFSNLSRFEEMLQLFCFPFSEKKTGNLPQ